MRNIITIGAFLVLALLIGTSLIGYLNTNTYQITVTDKETKKDSERSKYIVFTELDNGETKVFENTDALLIGKFNSSDLQGELKIGERYEVKTIGFRIPIVSMYENIVEVTK